MLYIKFVEGRDYWEGHVPIRQDSLSWLHSNAEDVVSVQADGHELEHLKVVAPNYLPGSSKRVVTVHGDLAKSIVANL